MELQILEKKENPLLHRLELKFVVKHEKEKTPSREDVRNIIAANLNADKKRVILQYIHTPFGSNESKGYAKIYESIEHAMKVEPEYILIRNKLIEKKEEE